MSNKKLKILFSLVLLFSPTAFAQPIVNAANIKVANNVIKIFGNRINWLDKCVCCEPTKKSETHLFIASKDLKQLTKLEKMLLQRGPYEEILDLVKEKEFEFVVGDSLFKRELDWAFPPIGVTYKSMYRHANLPHCLQ
jgi:hypothetical protein